MKEEIEKRRAEAAEKKKQIEEETTKQPSFAISPKGSSKVKFRQCKNVLFQISKFYFLNEIFFFSFLPIKSTIFLKILSSS